MVMVVQSTAKKKPDGIAQVVTLSLQILALLPQLILQTSLLVKISLCCLRTHAQMENLKISL